MKVGKSITCFALVLSGCASGKIDQLDDTVSALKKELQEVRSIQAEHTASINEIRAQVGQLSGAVEETQHLAKGRTEELERTLESVSSRVPPPAGVPEELLNRDDESISRIQSPAAATYRSALQLLRRGDFERSLGGFTSFISENPGTAYTDNALFWSGVCYEKMGQLDRAVGAYSDVFQRFPAEDFVPISLLRLGETFAGLGQKQEAAAALQKLIDEHPRASEAVRARELLAQLQPAKGGKKRR